jgi:CspA family cold shock protein
MAEFGKVIFFNPDRGWGFVKPKSGGADIFVHASECGAAAPLIEGQTVQYDIGVGRDGRPCAVHVRPLDVPVTNERLTDASDQARSSKID